MTVLDLAGRLVVVRDAAAIAQHQQEVLRERRASAARFQRSKQRAKRLCRTAPWADGEKIAEFYRLAAYLTRKTKIPHEVDHIIPLQGRTVSGLHVETNLQVIPKKENRLKWNRFQEDLVGGAGIEPATSTV